MKDFLLKLKALRDGKPGDALIFFAAGVFAIKLVPEVAGVAMAAGGLLLFYRFVKFLAERSQ